MLASTVPLLLLAGLYLWTAMSSAPTDDLGSLPPHGFYPALADALSRGQLYLDVAPSPELLALPDPYDPAANHPFRLHDASLFGGRYYLYFGITPAVTLFLPLLLLGVTITEPVAAALFAWAGLVFAVALFAVLVKRYVPTMRQWLFVLGVAVLGTANAVPFTLRRPAVYEVAITAGLCFSMLSALTALLTTMGNRHRLTLLGASWGAAGLAAGARPHLILVALLPAWATLRLAKRLSWRRAMLTTTPFVVIIVGLLAYNERRFGSPLEFGSSFQLAGINTNTYDTFDPVRLLGGVFFYYAQPPAFSWTFPFVTLEPAWPGGGLPPAFMSVEKVGGLLVTAPVVLLGLGALLAVWLKTRPRRTPGLRAAVAFVGLGAVISWAPMVTYGSATERYVVDWATLVLLGSMLALALLIGKTAGIWRALITFAGAMLGVASVAVGLALGLTGYYDGLRTGQPGTYRAMENAFAFIPGLASYTAGRPLVQSATSTPNGVLEVQVASGRNAASVLSIAASSAHRPWGQCRISTVHAGGVPVRVVDSEHLPARLNVRLRTGINRLSISALCLGPKGGRKAIPIKLLDLSYGS